MSRTTPTLGDRLRQAVEQSDLSATELAERLNVSRAQVSHWMTGRRIPSSTQLERISDALSVDSGWLLGENPRRSHAARRSRSSNTVALQSATGWWWRAEPDDGGRDYGNSNVFATPPDLSTLVRETGQNSVDVPARPGSQIHLRYSVIELTEGGSEYRAFMEALRFEGLQEHIQAAASTPSKLGSRLRSGLERLRQEKRVVLLRIDDYGTTGLFGDERSQDREEQNPFAALCRNNLDSSKLSSTAGGSFGLGKAVLWRCSDLSTVLFASDIAPDRRQAEQMGIRLIGKAELTWHDLDEPYAGPGWFAKEGTDAESLWVEAETLIPLQLDRSNLPRGVDARRASGTSILIVGFRDPQGQDPIDPAQVTEDLVRAVAFNFWPLIIQQRLSVTVERWCDGERRDSLVVEPNEHVPEMCEALTRHYHNEVVEELTEVGDVVRCSVPLTVMRTKLEANGLREFPEDVEAQCQLIVRVANSETGATSDRETQGTVALVRGRGMVVRYWPQRNIVVGGRPFHAVLLAGEAVGAEIQHLAAEQFLRASEPPAHDKWEYNDELRDNYYRGTGQRLAEFFERVTNALRTAIRPTEEGEEEGPVELRRLLRLSTGVPKPPPPVTIRRPRAVTRDGAWTIEGEIHINDRSKGWRIIPRLWLDVESGTPIRLAWDQLDAGRGEAVKDGHDVFLLDTGVRRLAFDGRSATHAEGIPATSCRVKLDLRVDEINE